ncbi:hypothetical protein ON010_g2410 [Phytophthora cinnamomi]|nr:hypothetical protein ON010_g2410 [Phytophthora cinnamomi]
MTELEAPATRHAGAGAPPAVDREKELYVALHHLAAAHGAPQGRAGPDAGAAERAERRRRRRRQAAGRAAPDQVAERQRQDAVGAGGAAQRLLLPGHRAGAQASQEGGAASAAATAAGAGPTGPVPGARGGGGGHAADLRGRHERLGGARRPAVRGEYAGADVDAGGEQG